MLWALVILFVVLITGAVVMRSDLASYKQTQKRALKRRAHWLAESGIERFLAELNDSSRDPEGIIERQFTDSIDENESIARTLSPWAGTLLAVSIGTVGTVSDTSSEIIGQESDLPDSVLVRTRNLNYPLVIAGSINLPMTMTGTVGLPVKIVSKGGHPAAALFAGRGPAQSVVDDWTYDDTSALEFEPWVARAGLVKSSEEIGSFSSVAMSSRVFTALGNDELFDEVDLVVRGNLELVDCTLNVAGIPRSILVDGSITVRGKSMLTGNIKLRSRQAISITESATLNGVSLISDSLIQIDGEAIVEAHILSGMTVRINESATLMPRTTVTAFLDVDKISSLPVYSILLNSMGETHCSLNSFTSDNDSNRDIPRVKIESRSRFTGVLASNHFIELESNAVAQFDIGSFWRKTSTSTYLNWMIDQRIRRQVRNSKYCVVYEKGKYVRMK